MAFLNPPKITLVADNVVRLSAVDDRGSPFGLGAGASGTIGLHGSGAEVELPAAFKPGDYGNAIAKKVDLQSSIQVLLVPTSNGGLASMQGYVINKTGTKPSDFEIAIGSDATQPPESPPLTLEFELYIRFH